MSTELTREDLIQFQENMIAAGKQVLEKSQHLMPMFFVLVRQMEVDSWLRSTVLDAKTWRPPERIGEAPMDLVSLIIQAPYDHAETLVHFIKYLSPDPHAAEFHIGLLTKMAPVFGVHGDPNERLAKTFMKMFKCSGKDIVASFVRKVCHTTNAIAYVKVCEAWVLKQKIPEGTTPQEYREWRKSRPADLADDPDSVETMTSFLETKDFKRHSTHEFFRDVRHSGKVIGWGERRVEEDDGTDGQRRIEGRFFDLLQKPPEAAAQEG